MMMDDMLLGGDAHALSDDDAGVEPDVPVIPDEEEGRALPPDLNPEALPGEPDDWADGDKPSGEEDEEDEFDIDDDFEEF